MITSNRTAEEIILISGSALEAFSLSARLRNIPIITGRTEMTIGLVIVEMIGSEILVDSIFCHANIQPKAKGMVKGVNSPMTAVKETDKLTSPLAR